MRYRVATRLLQIQRALVRHGLDDFVRATHLYRPFRFLFYLSPWTWFQRSAGVTRGERLRLALEELGPIFVKFGQAVSTRRDLIPADIADELAKLQDRVPPFDSAVAAAAIEQALRAAARRLVRELRGEAARRGIDRAGPRGPAAKRRGSRGQGVAARHARHHRAGSRGAGGARAARRRILERCAPPASDRDRRRIPQDHPRRARSDARGGQCRPVEAQLHGVPASVRARRVLGLLPVERHGDGADPRHHHQPDRGAQGTRHQFREARGERGRDFLHAGVPPQFLPRRHASGQHLRAGRRSAKSALRGDRLRHRRHPRSARSALPRLEFPRVLRSRLRARRRAARGIGLGSARPPGSTSSSPRCERSANRSSTSR